jgi:hypothetical protein
MTPEEQARQRIDAMLTTSGLVKDELLTLDAGSAEVLPGIRALL